MKTNIKNGVRKMGEIQNNHLDGEFGVTNKVKRALYDASRSFIYIGFLLEEAERFNYYLEGGFTSIYEYCEAEFDFGRSSTNNFIRVYQKFGEAMNLKEPYRRFSYSQLVEMCSCTDNQLNGIKPEMTISQIRDYKRQVKCQKNTVVIDEIEDGGFEAETYVSHNIKPINKGVCDLSKIKPINETKQEESKSLIPKDFYDVQTSGQSSDYDFTVSVSGDLALEIHNLIFGTDFLDKKRVKPQSFMANIYSYIFNNEQKKKQAEVEIIAYEYDSELGRCPKCKSIVQLDDNYCSDCGVKFASQKSEV